MQQSNAKRLRISPPILLSFLVVTSCNKKPEEKTEAVSTKAVSAEAVSAEAKQDAERQAVYDKTPTAPASATPRKLVRPQPLPRLARLALNRRMIDHGDDMEGLLWSALMLDHESTSAIADRMAAIPTLSRPGPNTQDTLNAMLPAEFFTLQDALGNAMVGLKRAADSKDNVSMAKEYGKMVETCIHCHSLYLSFPTTGE